MQRIANERLPFVRTTMSKADAIEKFSKMGENFKVEIIEGIEGDTVSLYTCGDFTDLCRGPHVPHTGFSKASKIFSAAGAYWRGDEKNPMLSRLYGTAFADEKALNAYLKQLEEAKRRDHRKLGRELGFFTFHEDVAPGMVFWLPKGMLMRTILKTSGVASTSSATTTWCRARSCCAWRPGSVPVTTTTIARTCISPRSRTISTASSP